MSREIYNELYKRGYPHGGLGFPITWSGIDCSKLRALDIGCGHGILCKKFKGYVGIDISDFVIEENKKKYPGVEFVQLDAIDLGSNDFGKFDVVIAIDTLEHFPKDNIDNYLHSISGVNSHEFLFSICCRESGFKSMAGENLHTCILNKEEWIDKIEDNFTIIDVSDMNAQKTFCAKAVL